eukprot:PhM_4_TR18649/c2_g4_i3/m.23156
MSLNKKQHVMENTTTRIPRMTSEMMSSPLPRSVGSPLCFTFSCRPNTSPRNLFLQYHSKRSSGSRTRHVRVSVVRSGKRQRKRRLLRGISNRDSLFRATPSSRRRVCWTVVRVMDGLGYHFPAAGSVRSYDVTGRVVGTSVLKDSFFRFTRLMFNWDSVVVSAFSEGDNTAVVVYNHTSLEYELPSTPNADVRRIDAFPKVSFVVNSSSWLIVLSDSDETALQIELDGLPISNAFERTLSTIYSAPIYDLKTVGGTTTTTYSSPATVVNRRATQSIQWPRTPCGTVFPNDGRDIKMHQQQSVDNDDDGEAQNESASSGGGGIRLAVCLGGLLRAVSHPKTLQSLQRNVLSQNKNNTTSHVYVSTWNIVGNVHKYTFHRSTDRVVPHGVVTSSMRELLGDSLVWMKEHDYEMTTKHWDARHKVPIAFHFHISHCLAAVRNHSKRFQYYYDVILLTRPDVSWRKPLTFFANVLSINNTKWHIRRGEVLVDEHDSMYYGNAWSAGDWAVVGDADTVLRWESLYSYSRDNFVSQGGGVLLAAFMREIQQRWRSVPLDIRLVRATCWYGDMTRCTRWKTYRGKGLRGREHIKFFFV